MLSNEVIFFTLFIVFIVTVLMIDLKFIGKNSHIVSFKEASIWSVIWVSTALLFFVFIRYFGEHIHGIQNIADLKEVITKYSYNLKIDESDYAKSLDMYRKNMSVSYLSGYFIEKSLSVDNLFVILMILTGFSVRKENYKPVLFYGILGALVLRFIFIFAGSALVHQFSWLLLVFGAFLIFQGVKMFIQRNIEETIEPQNHKLVKFLSKRFPVYPRFVKDRFFVRKSGKLFVTPLLIVLIFIEFSDVIFAFDSIPAIFSVSIDPYVVFFSNVFAILGLRALFFLLIKVVDMFHYLKVGISFLLAFIGFKLLFHTWLDKIGFKTEYSLFIILFILVTSIVLSLVFSKKELVVEK